MSTSLNFIQMYVRRERLFNQGTTRAELIKSSSMDHKELYSSQKEHGAKIFYTSQKNYSLPPFNVLIIPKLYPMPTERACSYVITFDSKAGAARSRIELLLVSTIPRPLQGPHPFLKRLFES